MSSFVEPLGPRILIRKDESRQQTRGGIVLPDSSEIPTITGRVVEVSVEVSNDEDFPVRKYDKVLFHPANAIPVDFEPENLLYVVPMDDVVAVFRNSPANQLRLESGEISLDDLDKPDDDSGDDSNEYSDSEDFEDDD